MVIFANPVTRVGVYPKALNPLERGEQGGRVFDAFRVTCIEEREISAPELFATPRQRRLYWLILGSAVESSA